MSAWSVHSIASRPPRSRRTSGPIPRPARRPFSWIDSYTHLVDERTQRSLGMEITLSKWFFDGVMDKRNVLAISPFYF